MQDKVEKKDISILKLFVISILSNNIYFIKNRFCYKCAVIARQYCKSKGNIAYT